MTRRSIAVPVAVFHLDASNGVPLYKQIYDRLRAAILAGQLKPGTRLPSTRGLAAELKVSRNTVLNAFEQLFAEGYLEGQTGAGTFVTRSLPDELLNVGGGAKQSSVNPTKNSISRRAAMIHNAACPSYRKFRAFNTGMPAVDAFPFELWSRMTARRWRRPKRDLLGYSHPAGYRPLREAIAEYLGAARGVRCEADQIIIVTGTQQLFDLTGRILLDPGDHVWFENPGYISARYALTAVGARLVPIPVDDEGINVKAGAKKCPDARLAYVTPSHQYPLGATMSLTRRLELLEWANQAGAWILEDDYDSEYRYAGRPLSALQGLNENGRVIYIGTFSKVLLPALRIGYMVVPPDLVDVFINARSLSGWCSPIIDQMVVTDFIREGHFARHIRRMRSLYAERQAILVEAARRDLKGLLEVQPSAAGMHLVGWLPEGVDDKIASEKAAEFGVETRPLSSFAIEEDGRNGLLLGYSAYNEREIREGVVKLAAALKDAFKTSWQRSLL